MNKTLWISDLDGTLLNKDKQISHTTEQIINRMILEGENFTIATARTPATVGEMLQNLHMTMPVVVMNGAAIYHLKIQRYEHTLHLEKVQAGQIQNILEKHKKNAFIYTLYEDSLTTYYESLQNKHEVSFYEERKNKLHKRFIQEKVPEDATILYFTIMGDESVVKAIYEEGCLIKGIKCIYSQDVYDSSNYYLEIYHEKVSKAYAIAYLRKHYDFNRVICFGDQVNDRDMFEVCEEKYATENAVSSIKHLATAVIGHHHEDGVAKFIEEHRKK